MNACRIFDICYYQLSTCVLIPACILLAGRIITGCVRGFAGRPRAPDRPRDGRVSLIISTSTLGNRATRSRDVVHLYKRGGDRIMLDELAQHRVVPDLAHGRGRGGRARLLAAFSLPTPAGIGYWHEKVRPIAERQATCASTSRTSRSCGGCAASKIRPPFRPRRRPKNCNDELIMYSTALLLRSNHHGVAQYVYVHSCTRVVRVERVLAAGARQEGSEESQKLAPG